MTVGCVIEAFVGSCILWAIISFLPLKPSMIESISCRFNVVQFSTVFHFPLIYSPKTKVLKVALDTGCLAVRTRNLVSFSFEKFLFWIKSGLKQTGLSYPEQCDNSKTFGPGGDFFSTNLARRLFSVLFESQRIYFIQL